MKEERFKLKILILFVLTMAFLLGAMFFIVNRHLGDDTAKEWTDTFKGVEKTFPAELRLDADSMDAVLHAVVEDERLRDALRRKDRDALLKKAQPFFQSLLSQHDITHFYFTGTDRVNILRVHQPERFGDTINRFTTLEAERTGKPAWGIELGPLGTFALRVVAPWFEGERLIGYVELGKEIDRSLEEIRERYQVGLLVFIRKELIKRQDWEKGMRMLGKEADWERFPSVVNVGATLEGVAQEVLETSVGSQKPGAANDKVISAGNRHYSFGNIPLIDAGGREVGYMTLFKDQTDTLALRQSLITTLAIVFLTAAAVLSVIFYFILRRVETDLNNSRMNLVNANNELVEKSRMIDESLQQKKKVNEELEKAQDASLNIMADLNREVAERKQAEEAVRRLNDELEQKVIARTAALEHARLELEQASRGKDEFLAAISHELKTPLNHILGFADLLKEGLVGELSAEQKGMAQDIFDAGRKQLAIVNSLIELARLQAGKVELQAKPEDTARMLGEIAARHAAKAEAAGLAFATEVAQGLGEMPLDREVVTHILDQLLENAFKFTPSGGKVSLTARRVPRTDVAAPVRIEAGEYLELAVADNGPGIAPEILPRLFQPFVQGDGRLARSHQGTGVGLMLVKLLAELHGGGSSIESKPGTGAKFLVWLPC